MTIAKRIVKSYSYESESGSLRKELMDQLALLLSTPVGTVVLDRDFGIDFSFVDMPLPIAQTMLAAELAEKIEKYIPQLTLREVILTYADTDGNLNVKVVVDIVE